MFKYPLHWNYFSFPFYYFLPPGVQASIHLIGCRRILLFLPFLFSFANSDNGCSSTHWDFRFFSLFFLFKILPSGVQASINLLNCLPGKMNLGKDIFCCYLLFLLFLGRRDWLEGDFFLSFLLFTFFFLKKGNELVFAKDSPVTGQKPARFPNPLAFASKSKWVGEPGAGLH